MFNALSDWFKQQLQQPTVTSKAHTVELATAVLLYEIMRADNTIESSERDAFESLLDKHFSLSQEEKQNLFALSEKQANHATDFHQFTHVLNQNCSAEEKRKMIESLWRVAYADKHIDVHETHLIRRISDLLHIPHSEFIRAKLKVTEER
jgi:uncharacterized tellurite resistance protein B-like protein